MATSTGRVLVTGGAGFIGTNLSKRLVDAGYKVRVLDTLSPQIHGDDPTRTSQLFQEVSQIAEVISGSVTDRNALEGALCDVDVVIHLAAETGTGQSMYEIDRYVSTNIGGTALLLDILRNTEHNVTRIVYASSRAIYGEGKYVSADGTVFFPGARTAADLDSGFFEIRDPVSGGAALPVPTDETSAIHPSSVYGITKQSQEQLIMVAAPTMGITPVALRYQNVYGPGQSLSNPYTGILSVFSSLALDGKPINVFEDGKESRDFVFIDDVVSATVLALEKEEAGGQVFNVGSGEAIVVNEVVELLTTSLGVSADVFISGNYRLGDIRHNVADLSKIREALGYEPAVRFSEGIRRFAEWVLTQPRSSAGYARSLDELKRRDLFK